jgi:hypothetical protein
MFYQPWGLHGVGVSVDNDPVGIAIPSPASEVFVPPGGFSSAPLVVTPAVVQAGSYTARATFQGQEKTAPVHVVDTTDVALEYQKPDGTWSPPDTFLVGASGVPVVSAADPLRWEATFTHDTAQLQPTWVSLEAISWSDWLARQQVPPTEAWPTVVTGENCTGPAGSRECIAHGAPNVGDWAVRAVVWYNGGPAGGGGPGGVGEPARQLTPEHVVVMEIESVDWWEDTVRPDAGDLTVPPSGHAGDAFFPDAETAQDPANPALRVELLVNPNMAGIPILAKWVDVDDPFYSTAPLDEDQIGTGDLNSPDNRFDTARFDGAGQQVQLVTDGNGEASVVFLTSMQPGNNYRVVASLHQANLDTLKPMKVQGTALIWKDLDNDDTYDLNEPLLDETSPYSPAEGKVSQLLTVWRILDVEMDAFGPPAPGIVWDPDDDVPVANVPFPDPGLLAQAFEPAFVLAVPYQDQGNVPFTQPNYNLEEAEMPALAGYRQVGVTPAFWAAYVMQGYDSMLAKDNDPNSEPATVGHTKHLTPALSFVFLETIRDILVNEHPTYSAVLYAQQTVAHEIGHHFIPDRQDGHLMDPTAAPSGDGLTFSENDLALIRNKVQPQ